MMTFLVATVFMIVGFTLFAAAIHFSRYRQTEGRCCTAGLTDIDDDFDACGTCPHKDSEECELHDAEAELLEIK